MFYPVCAAKVFVDTRLAPLVQLAEQNWSNLQKQTGPTCGNGAIIRHNLHRKEMYSMAQKMAYNLQHNLQQTPAQYLPRIADVTLKKKLQNAGAVHIIGPKWCGKTATAQQQAKSSVYLQDPDQSSSLLQLADAMPSAILQGENPRLIDEWQMAPQLWDAVRYDIDRNQGRGRFILTGSATPRKKDMPKHSGVGRISKLAMRTMSLYETNESNGAVSLSELFSGHTKVACALNFDINRIAYALCRGGWPSAVTESNPSIALSMASDYITELIASDIDEIDGHTLNKSWLRLILRSYARNVASEASLATIARDMEGEPPSRDTVSAYIDVLTRACVLDDLHAWAPRLRSKTAIRTSPTRHFCDPSLAVAMLGTNPDALLRDFDTFGLLFESLCVHDLRVYMDALEGEVKHYRDKTGLEADAVLERANGAWALVEVKLGQKQIEEAATHLKKLARNIDSSKQGEPSFLMVVTGTNAAYTRPDGVIVAPLASLAP